MKATNPAFSESMSPGSGRGECYPDGVLAPKRLGKFWMFGESQHVVRAEDAQSTRPSALVQ